MALKVNEPTWSNLKTAYLEWKIGETISSESADYLLGAFTWSAAEKKFDLNVQDFYSLYLRQTPFSWEHKLVFDKMFGYDTNVDISDCL